MKLTSASRRAGNLITAKQRENKHTRIKGSWESTSQGMLGFTRTLHPSAAPSEPAQLCHVKDRGITDELNKIVLVLSGFFSFQGRLWLWFQACMSHRKCRRCWLSLPGNVSAGRVKKRHRSLKRDGKARSGSELGITCVGTCCGL